MEIKPFLVEEWMNAYETAAVHNIAETCVDSVSLDELFALTGVNKEETLVNLCARRLTYGDIWGAPALLEGISKQYRTIRPAQVIPTHGAAGANHLVCSALIKPGDSVVAVMPTYQQLYSIPESLGARVKILKLQAERGYLPDLQELRQLAAPGTKLICLTNPNNPTGALIPEEMLLEIVQIARAAGAYLLCDEVYRGLNQQDIDTPSVADLYERGISVSSMSKIFSLAGIRLGWIASPDETVRQACLTHRDYSLISCGPISETIAAIALQHAEPILRRNRDVVRTNLAILDGWVKSQPDIRYTKPQAGTTALLHYRFNRPSYDFCRELFQETGAFLTPGDCFQEEHSVRIGYACDQETLIAGLNALGTYLAQLAADQAHS